MALSLRKKSTISRRIKENVAKLAAGGLNLREKSAVSRAIKEDVALLGGITANDTPIEPVAPEIIEPTTIADMRNIVKNSDKGSAGEVINSIYKQWDNIKTESDTEKWNELVKNTNFGTYGGTGILEMLDRLKPTYPDEYHETHFIKEVKKALGISTKDNRTAIEKDLDLERDRKAFNDDLARIKGKESALTQNEITPIEATEPTPIAAESPLAQKSETRKDTSHFYEFDENRKPAQRKRENQAAIALLKQVRSGEIDGATLTDEQKGVLAKYSGLGGGKSSAGHGEDGQFGSAFEYYTPKPIAEGIWNLAKDLGFEGGKVLDPCAGVGIFGATAPLNCVVDAVELDKTSGEINKLVNQGTGVSVTVSPFEKVAAVTSDAEYDVCIGNVPFGDNAARGSNKNLDGKYRKENLQTYFILRSLEKLKPKGLAIFIVPTSIVDNKGAKEENLRIQASYMAEFLGAYRLPSKVFNTASTDVITDVIVFKKYDKDTLEKIQELREQNAETLIDANVQWQPFISGKYFLGEGKRFILGEFVPKDPLDNSQWARDKVINHAPLGEIGAMLRKFPDSRVKWDVLETTETAPIIYQEGDCITQAGQTLQYQQGQWIAVEARNQDIDADLMASNFASPQQAFETGMTYEQAFSYLEFMQSTSQILSAPSWLVSTVNGLQKSDNVNHAKLWNAGIVGMTVADILGERLGSEEGVNFEEEYPKLSAAMLVQCGNAKSLTPKANGQLKTGLQTLAVHCKKGTGFSGLWRGDVAANAPKALTNESMSFDGLLYKNQSQWASIEDAKAIHSADFDPFKTDDYCISADGKSICKADDYYSGNYRKFLERADADIAAATDSTVKDKLLRQKLLAESKLDKIDVKNIGFTLNSPLVSLEDKLAFVQKFVHPQAFINYDKDGKGYVDIDIKIGTNSPYKDKLFNRFGDYMKGGKVSLGGIDGASAKDGLNELRAMVATAETQFGSWVKANGGIMNRIDEKANSIDSLEFKQSNDEDPLSIPNMNPELKLHGYQCAFVRQMGRDFSGINGMAVGLGKTFSALAAVQYSHSTGTKSKTLFVVPNSVLSNWQKEAGRAYENTDDCLYVGLREGKNGKSSVDSKAYDDDLQKVLENKHSKIFVTYESFKKIKMRTETLKEYETYLGISDRNFAPSMDVKEREKAESKKADLMAIFEGKTGAAPFLEDMGIDSIVYDEGHIGKNASQTVEAEQAKFLSIAGASGIGLEMQAKSWFIRGKSERGDGILLLTATPLTNSPLEYYSMLSIAKGHKKVNDMMLGINGADDFMALVCDIESQSDVTIDGIERDKNVFIGLNNVSLLRRSLGLSATIKTAADVGNQVVLPDEDAQTTNIDLPDEIVERLQLYKGAFRYAIDSLSEKSPNRGDVNAFNEVSEHFGEPLALIGHPFNLINKMTLLIADPELDKRATFFTINPADKEKAQKAIDEFNKRKIIEKRPRESPYTSPEAVVGKITTKDAETGDSTEILKIHVLAVLQPDGKTIVIDSIDSTTQLRFDDIIDKIELDVEVTIPPKLAALLENVKKEQATPRGMDDDGKASPIVKQIVFCDILALHSKIKRLLAKKAGISSSKIAIITGKINNTPEEIMQVQDGFNAHGEENTYNVIIANEKAEVGINLQKGTQAIHHLTIGWTPDSLTQRNGRGVRQGNKTEKVTVYTYDADGTFDAVKRTMVGKKADWIESVMAKEGENKVAISGGLSREQQEELIDVVGDKAAMSKIQERVAAKEAASRAETNRGKQLVHLDTIKKQSDFVAKNDPIESFVIPKMVRIWAMSFQIQGIQKKNTSDKISTSAFNKNETIIAQLTDNLNALIAEIEGSVSITADRYNPNDRSHTAESISVKEILDTYQSGSWCKNTVADFNSHMNGRYTFTVTQGGAIDTEWQADMAMAKSMIDESKAEFETLAKENGAYPKEVAQGMIDGTAGLLNGKPVMEGAFLRSPELAVFKKNGTGFYLDFISLRSAYYQNRNNNYTASFGTNFILKGTSEYEACLIEAAKLEDDTGFNTYSDINADVSKYRSTAVLVEYNRRDCLLPPPYFPRVISDDDLSRNPLLKDLRDKQSEVVKQVSHLTFKAEATVGIIEGECELEKSFIEYAIANNVKMVAVGFTSITNREYRTQIARKIAESVNVDEFKRLLSESVETNEQEKCLVDYVIKLAPFVDFSMIDFDGIDDFAPSIIWEVFESTVEPEVIPADIVGIYGVASSRDASAAFRESLEGRWSQYDSENGVWNVQRIVWTNIEGNDPALVKSGRLKLVDATVQSTAPAESPDDIVAITGRGTKALKETIKFFAKDYGDGKYRWDKNNSAWLVKRVAWDEMIKQNPKYTNDTYLYLTSTTVTRL